MFELHDKVVYPGHGVATIERVLERKIGTVTAIFFELKFSNKDITIMVPKERMEEVGIRPLSSRQGIEAMFETLVKPARRTSFSDISLNNWNKRSKEYQSKIRTGSLTEISEVYRDLKHISRKKELSFGEKNLLQKTEMLLVEEIIATNYLDEQRALEQLRMAFMSTTMMQATDITPAIRGTFKASS